MREKLVKDLQGRFEREISSRNGIAFARTLDVGLMVDTAASVLFVFTRTMSTKKHAVLLLSEVATAIGHGIRHSFQLPKNSSMAVKLGAFILYTFEQHKIFTLLMTAGRNGHATYTISETNDDVLTELWNCIDKEKRHKLPSTAPFAPWETYRHETGITMIKTFNKDVLKAINKVDHPHLFDTLNRSQAIGWNINREVLKVAKWAMRNKADAFSSIWSVTSAEAKQSKLREAKAVLSLGAEFETDTIYHLYYFDFRGRKYATTAYLHEQGSDLARGFLLRNDGAPLTMEGFEWMLICLASNWGGDAGRSDGYKTDKIPRADRIAWSLDNEDILLSYAEKPTVNQGWMHADKPWQFLAGCMELAKLRIWQCTEGEGIDDYNYVCHLEGFVDGSNNGSQHLAALVKDERTAPHVNLIPQELPGDLYLYVAKHVWDSIDKTVEVYTEEEYAECESVIANLADLKKQLNDALPKSERRKLLVDNLARFRKSHNLAIAMSSPVFWHKIRDDKSRRKICKRNVMTLPYGGTSYGLGQQQIDDARKHGIESLTFLEHKWGSYMGRQVFEDCKRSLERPMRLLRVFENAGRVAEEEGLFLSWKVPITNFPVTQHYTEGTVKKLWVQYGPPVGRKLSTGYYENTLQLHVSFSELPTLSKGKQASGASPNIIHSLDAAHLMLITSRSDFGVTTIHDSFGCLFADMPRLFDVVRETFVELYDTDPLGSLIAQIGGDMSEIEIGTLDIREILKSEYAFI